MAVPTRLTRKITCNQSAVRAVRFNVDGNYCVTCGSDKTVKLWNPYEGTLLRTYTGTGNEVLDAATSCDNSLIAVGGKDRALSVYDVQTGKMYKKWRGHAANVNAVAFNEESNVAFSASMDCTVRAYDMRSKNENPIQVFNEASDSVLSIDVNGHEIVTGSADCHLRIYSVRDGSMFQDFMGEAVTCVHFTPDSNCVLASTMDGNLRLMDKLTGKMLAKYTGHRNADYRVESGVLASLEHVVSGGEDGRVLVWNMVEQTVSARLEHPTKIVHSLSTHPKKPALLTAAADAIYLWAPPEEIEE